MKKTLTVSLISLILLCSSSLAAQAQATVNRHRAVSPNSQGGYTGSKAVTRTRPNGTSVQKVGGFETDGQGNVVYGSQSTGTAPSGRPINRSTTGSGSYVPGQGYSGGSTTTINGNH